MKNKGIKFSIIIVGLGVALLETASVSAANYLKDISVRKAGNTVVAVISTSEPCDFDKLYLSGKPERVVVDLQGVVNAWTTKKFDDLPFTSIMSIRSSQFQNDPLVTRVVFDIGRSIEFDVSQSESDIIVKIPAAPDESDFQEWSTAVSSRKTLPAVVQAPRQQPTAAPAQEKRMSPGVKIESIPKKTMVYRTSNFRDPFVSLVGASLGHLSTELPALENLTLVGVLSDIDGNRALLEDAEGNGYILMPNDKVKNGYLVSVSETKAIFQITEYGWTRTVALELDLPELR